MFYKNGYIMSKKDENKNTKAAAEQPESTQSVAAAETPDTQSAPGGGMERPHDGEGAEAVTVVIVMSDPQRTLLAERSVRKNLVGADALVLRLDISQNPLAVALSEMLKATDTTERIILMTDCMLFLNPVAIYEVGVHKAVPQPKGLSYQTRMPVMMRRSVLLPLLEQLEASDLPYADIVDAYMQSEKPAVLPVVLKQWNTERWLLPVVSENPSMAVIAFWAKTQHFMHVSPRSWNAEIVKFLEDRYPE